MTKFAGLEAAAAAAKPGLKTWDALAYIRQYLDELVHEAGGIEEFVEKFRVFYRTEVATFDIPGIQNLLEKTVVDPALETAAVALIRAAHNAIHAT